MEPDSIPKEVNCYFIIPFTQSRIETSFYLLLQVNDNVIFFHYSAVKSSKCLHQRYFDIEIFSKFYLNITSLSLIFFKSL